MTNKEMAEAWNTWGTMCRLALLAYVICRGECWRIGGAAWWPGLRLRRSSLQEPGLQGLCEPCERVYDFYILRHVYLLS